jgi:hypothetical protein
MKIGLNVIGIYFNLKYSNFLLNIVILVNELNKLMLLEFYNNLFH